MCPTIGTQDTAEQTSNWLYREGLAELLGQQKQVANPELPARSNAFSLGLSGMTDGALAATGVCAAVAVAVTPGIDTISNVRIFAGVTPESGGSHAFAAIYSGIAVPALLGQSVDQTGAAAVGASAAHDFPIPAIAITAAMAPNGYIYVSLSMTGTPASAAVISTPTAIGYQWFTTAPLFLSATHGSAVAGVAPATIASPAAKAVAPIVVLT